ncbi:MAG: hypothetical protein RMJ34_05145 [candidate division WOR-3 bacterium]|nr:hypothetical protein [candidate division WOR-3 bacterium]MDW8114302.1 hypothetical protein [candidate division WOR-3 bacterium]
MKRILVIMINILVFCGFYKIGYIGCGSPPSSAPLDIPDSTLSIEIDKKEPEYYVSVYIFKNTGEWVGLGNGLIKKIEAYEENIYLRSLLPDTIKFDIYSPDPNLVLNLLQHFTYRDTWLKNGDSWILYVCGASYLYEISSRELRTGVCFNVENLNGKWASLCYVASGFIEDFCARSGFNSHYSIQAAVAHEIGHAFNLEHCNRLNCVMFGVLIWDNPQRDYCTRCRELLKSYYLPIRYGSRRPPRS